MVDSPDVSREYVFTPSVDLPSTLESLNIQYLNVNESQVLVIFNTAILNLESVEGKLSNLHSTEIMVYELSRDTTTAKPESNALTLITDFIDQIASTEKTTVSLHE
ncbi:hypothetical protein [Natronococcus wangiae]|uniref:hypothetical protein n=1 Tax=Natronococcus wangiae TaxID=3068275 RepID=UPI002740053B|nr:hypothetical protein [Natronococcus sp. AD5]